MYRRNKLQKFIPINTIKNIYQLKTITFLANFDEPAVLIFTSFCSKADFGSIQYCKKDQQESSDCLDSLTF